MQLEEGVSSVHGFGHVIGGSHSKLDCVSLRFAQIFGHVTNLVNLAALEEGSVAGKVADRSPNRLTSVNHVEPGLVEVDSTSANSPSKSPTTAAFSVAP